MAAPLAALRRIATTRPAPVTGERCEMCAESIPDEHQHVVDVQSRVLMCTCRGCYLLFDHADATLRYRAVPDRYLEFPGFDLAREHWDALEIPVGLAFFFHNSVRGTTTAFYPGPAGATESELPLDAWSDVLAADPRLRDHRAGRRGPAAQGPRTRRPRHVARRVAAVRSAATSSLSTPVTPWSAGCARSGAVSTAGRRRARRSTSSSSDIASRSRPAPEVEGHAS